MGRPPIVSGFRCYHCKSKETCKAGKTYRSKNGASFAARVADSFARIRLYAIGLNDGGGYEETYPQAMPVILDNIEAQKECLLNGNRDLLVPYAGELIADEMLDTLEKLYPEENPPMKERPVSAVKEKKESAQGWLFG